jgi:hypothetical protein
VISPLQVVNTDWITVVAIVTPITVGTLVALFKLVADVAILKNDVKAIKRKVGLGD